VNYANQIPILRGSNPLGNANAAPVNPAKPANSDFSATSAGRNRPQFSHQLHESREISREIAARVISEFGGPSVHDILGTPRVGLRAARQAFALTHPRRSSGFSFLRVLTAINTLKAGG
jgi:hypothetical protein